MSNIAALGKNFFLVQTRDVPNGQRGKHIAEHMEYNIPLIDSGYIVAGGGLLSDGALSSDTDAMNKISGSFIVVRADTIEEVWAALKKDVFYTSSEVWDHASITVTPVVLGAPKIA